MKKKKNEAKKKRIPEMSELRKLTHGRRWTEKAAKLVLAKLEFWNGSVKEFCDRLGMDGQRIVFWRKKLGQKASRAQILAEFHPPARASAPRVAKKHREGPTVTKVRGAFLEKKKDYTFEDLRQLWTHVNDMVKSVSDGPIKGSLEDARKHVGNAIHCALDVELRVTEKSKKSSSNGASAPSPLN